MGRKHCGKRRNCSLRAISPFPTVFSKGLFPRGVKRCHLWEWVNKTERQKQTYCDNTAYQSNLKMQCWTGDNKHRGQNETRK